MFLNNMSAKLNYYHNTANFQALEFPYKGEKLGFFILLPDEQLGIKKLEKSLTGEVLRQLPQKMSKISVDVTLPKFKMEKDYTLNEVLIKWEW